jgi:hypothetical protein
VQPLGEFDPAEIGPYRLDGRLGSGKATRVYLGQSAEGRSAAVAVIKESFQKDPKTLERFRQEVQTLRAVRSGHIPALIAFEVSAPPYWYATEFIPGTTLEEMVSDKGALPAAVCRNLMTDMAEAIADIHRHGVCHQNIRPQNVVLSPGGATLVQAGHAAATPGYSAPEVFTRNLTGPAGDVFSLGATMAFAATGRPPYGQGASADIAHRSIHENVDIDGVVRYLADLISACVVPDPRQRPPIETILDRCRYPATDAEGGPSHVIRSQGVRRRRVLKLAAGAAGALAATAVGYTAFAREERPPVARVGAPLGHTPKSPAVRRIGDGSTADTGPQPGQPPKAERLEPGQRPPQFVVFSWDGAGELDDGLFARFRKVAKDHGASMTFFLSGLYVLPESKKQLYRPPQNPVGASAIGYLTDAHIKGTLRQVRSAWLEGHEIGTHFNGHFCDGSGSVDRWTPKEWRDEIDQAVSFVEKWRTNTGFTDLEPLPFDYRKELIGARTPCLLGQDNLLPTAADLGWRYDASSPGGLQIWPNQRHGVWDLPLQAVPFPGKHFEVLSMDYNMLANQSINATSSDPSNYPGWRKQSGGAYLAGFQRAYETNRAPLYIGNHFEHWNGGIYMDAVEEAMKRISSHPEVRLVSFRQLVDWLDAQDPAVLARLRGLGPGVRPPGGWSTFLAKQAGPSRPPR